MFDFISFIIGLLLGMIIMLVLVWIAYYNRTFVFTYCPTQARACSGLDYYNNPGKALSDGANIDDILFINDNNEMFYRRVPRTTTCIPTLNQVVPIRYPQYCSFKSNIGITNTYKQTVYGSNMYYLSNGDISPPVSTNGNCSPISNFYTSGVPLLKWDPSPIQD